MNCGLCSSGNLTAVSGADRREYFLCSNCALISVHPKHFLKAEEERKRYLTHNNSIEDTAYVEFLSRAVTPALDFIRKDMEGLDYGCGYAAVLSKILEERGYTCENYDPFFYPDEPRKNYDFIFCTEVFEHFFYPARDILKISSLLKKNGTLAVMTQLRKSIERFKGWHYTRDAAHTAFYSPETFDFICKAYGFEMLYSDNERVIILSKK
jgi:SAM-dependent methyltransferase